MRKHRIRLVQLDAFGSLLFAMTYRDELMTFLQAHGLPFDDRALD